MEADPQAVTKRRHLTFSDQIFSWKQAEIGQSSRPTYLTDFEAQRLHGRTASPDRRSHRSERLNRSTV
jgi:hypothetical protein